MSRPEPTLAAVRAENEALRRTLDVERDRASALEEELREARRLAAVGRAAAGVAHDVKNAMTVIGGYADVLLRRLDGADPSRGPAEAIRKATTWGLSLARDLLDCARSGPASPAAADLNAAVSAVARTIEPLLSRRVQLEVRLGPGLPPVSGTARELEQVVTNLLLNARDAVQERGRIVVETGPAELEPGRPGVVLEISDTGAGMDAATLARAFEPYFTTKPAGTGTGLGLATVFGIVTRHGGHVDTESEPGRGSRFKVYLAASAGDDEAGTPARDTPTVLVVEDERGVRDLIVEILEMQELRVARARDAEEALALAAELGDDLALLVVDVLLDGVLSLPLVERLTDARPPLRVLWVSGELDDPRRDSGGRRGAQSVIYKPFTVDALMRAVRQLLEPG